MILFTKLLEIFDLERIDTHVYQANNLDIGSFSVYGGQVLAQSILAAYKTVEGKSLNSIHGYFLLMGDNNKPIRYSVDVVRDGRSFSVRRVKAWQGDKNIFIMAASFHREENGLEHQKTMPNVPQPNVLTPFSEIFKEFAEKFQIKPKGFYSEDGPIVFHPIERYNPFNPGKKPPLTHLWFKPNGIVPKDDALSKAFLAYASDFSLLITALLPHDVSFFKTPMKIASLDHAMWFHKPINPNDWHLYVVNSPFSGNARGFCQGSMFNSEGDLVASIVQEGLIRILE
ncbi:MAG: acyl-CoA thioesterase II [Saprospiraceae bacterium]|nr:acyl-CoA thioesterase II [Saprospiraceae bacterium]